MLEGVLILRNSSLKLKTVADNTILRNYAVPSENISKRIKTKTENGFYLKRNVCIFRRNKSRPGKQSHRRQLYLYHNNKMINKLIAPRIIEHPMHPSSFPNAPVVPPMHKTKIKTSMNFIIL